MTLSQEQKKIEAESTAQRAEQAGLPQDRIDFLRTELDLYQVPNQINFHQHGHSPVPGQIDFRRHGHSQDVDDALVSDFFKSQPTGKFLSIGAANGIDQTWALLHKGWSGVYCEPDPVALTSVDGHGLLRATKDFSDRVMVVNAAIAATSGVCQFYINHTIALSTTKLHLSDTSSRPIIINSLGVNQLLDYVGEDFDYVQIDAEGADHEIITAIDWATRLPICKLLGVELGIELWRQLWEQGRYAMSSVTEHNTYFRRIVD
jgi:FkbM family methyltransferase